MDDVSPATAFIAAPVGGVRGVLEAAAAAQARSDAAALALVVATEGSTYVQPGAVALFGFAGGQVGWLSGGCLEPEIERRARHAAEHECLESLEIDTRDDAELLSGSAVGCRGRLRVLLLPLRQLPGFGELVRRWHAAPLVFEVDERGAISAAVGAHRREWQLRAPAAATTAPRWRIELARPPSVLLLGAGPESPALLPLLRQLGWVVLVAERRPRWTALAAPCDRLLERAPIAALQELGATRIDAAVVMHHHFELDREALEALAGSAIGFVGLLGPVRRREDLFSVLPARVREALAARLHSPVGVRLGGRGPEAIALSIAAQLQAAHSAA